MAIAKTKAVFQSDINDVWNVVTSLDNYGWRSDLTKLIKNSPILYRWRD